jgi:hypothetical protein
VRRLSPKEARVIAAVWEKSKVLPGDDEKLLLLSSATDGTKRVPRTPVVVFVFAVFIVSSRARASKRSYSAFVTS